MRKLVWINAAIIGALVLGSCSTSNSVVSNRLISKRKYTKGFYINHRTADKAESVKAIDEKVEEEVISNEKLAIDANLLATKTVTSESLPTYKHQEIEFNQAAEINSETVESNADEAKVVSSDNSVENSEATAIVEKSEKSESTLSKKELKKELKKQKSSSSSSSSDAKLILCIILAILFPALGVLVWTYPSIDWLKVLIAFLLTLLFWLPGVIYALLVVLDVI